MIIKLFPYHYKNILSLSAITDIYSLSGRIDLYPSALGGMHISLDTEYSHAGRIPKQTVNPFSQFCLGEFPMIAET